MTIDAKEARLRGMMRTYASPPAHCGGSGIREDYQWFIAAGAPPPATSAAHTIFEIGSITKVFTGILLCLMVEEGKVDPRAPLRHMAADLARVPGLDHAGAPNYPHQRPARFLHAPLKAMTRSWPEGPHAQFSRSDLLAWLDGWRGRAPGARSRHTYSNLGIGLIGEANGDAGGRALHRTAGREDHGTTGACGHEALFARRSA